MKKLQEIKLTGKADFLDVNAMKKILGGSGTNDCNSECDGSCSCEGGGSGTCRTTNWPDGTSSCTCGCGGLG